MKWQLEELTEDCIVSYLEGQVAGQLKILAAWNFSEPEFPCAIVHASRTEPIVEMATWHDARMLTVEVAVMTDAAKEIDTMGNAVKAARDRHIDAKTIVLDALCKTGLTALINAQATTGIAFSMAQVTSTERAVNEAERKLVTTIMIEVIAEPVTGS